MTATAQRTRSAYYNRLAGVLYLTIDGTEHGYYVDPLKSDWGRAWTLSKFRTQVKAGEPDAYDVVIDPEGGNHSCECKGWLHRRHCKHVQALLALHARGKI